jgi:epoxide hydrolase-like predicted phosphatase
MALFVIVSIMYKAILFDFFDVIAPDFYRVWLERNKLERTGEYLELAQDIDEGNITLEEYYIQLSSLSGQPAESLQNEFENEAKLNLELLELMAKLHKNYKTALLTNSPANLVRIILQENDLEQHFDEVIISGEVGYVKPDPMIYKLALGKLHVPAKEAIFIDDLLTYVKGAESVGIKSIQFSNISQLAKDLREVGLASA